MSEKYPVELSVVEREPSKNADQDAPLLEVLEQRTLFSADLPGLTGVDPLDQPASEITPLPLPVVEGNGREPAEVVFINSDVDDLELLSRDIERQAEAGRNISVWIIDSTTDGIARITDLLKSVQQADAVHIISHGSEHAVKLGNSWLDSDVLNQHTRQISQWRHALSGDADILLYGCDLAASEDGVDLVHRLGQLTGADVAASDDRTGHLAAQADWDIEYEYGAIEAEIAVSDVAQDIWSHDLATDAPVFSQLGGTPSTYHNFSAAVVLDSDVSVSVADESAAARYQTASISLERNAGANENDEFNIAGNFQPLTEGGNVAHNSDGIIGTVAKNSAGKLVVDFNANASTALVNELLQSLTYQTVEFGFVDETRTISWTFAIDSADGSGVTQSTIGQSYITASPVSAVANDDSLGELLSATSMNVTQTDLLSNDTVYSARPLTIVNTTEPVTGTVSESNGTFSYSSAVGATGTDHFDYTVTDGNPDIAHHWRMHSDMSDETGRLHGSVVGNPVSGPEGLDFNGNDYLVVPDLDYPDKFTLSFDFKVNDLSDGGIESFYRQGQWAQSNSIHIYAQGDAWPVAGHMVTYIKDSLDFDILHTGYRHDLSVFENDNIWHNYTLTREAGVGVRIFIDGVEQPTGSVVRGENAFNPVGDITVGAYQNREALDDHQMRDLRLYSAVLNQQEIIDNESNRYSTGRVSVELRNEEVLDTNHPLAVDEGGSKVIANTYLNTTDDDLTDVPENIVYTIDNDMAPINGQLYINTTVLSDGSVFTQKDINDGALRYQHDGSESTADSFRFTVDDGRGSTTTGSFLLDIEPVNDSPVVVENKGLIITEGDESTPIAADLLEFTDADDGPDELIYNIVTSPPAGDVVLTTDPLSAVNRFTQADVNAGRVQYRHDGSEGSDASFAFELADGGEDAVPAVSATFQISVDNVNDPPLLSDLDNHPVYNKTEGPVILDADLSVTDAELDTVFASDYTGTALTLQRSGGTPNTNDVFSASGLLSSLNEGSALVYDGYDIGLVVVNSDGQLVLSFADDATGALVNGAMRAIAYSHPATSPPDTVNLAWKFTDGNEAGMQGSGGALTVTGSSTVTIQAAPEFRIDAPDSITINEDTQFEFSATNAISIDDGILQDKRLQVELQTSDGGLLTFGDTSGLDVVAGSNHSQSITVVGDESAINAALQSLSYAPVLNDDTSDSLAIRLVPEADLVSKYEFAGNANDSSAGVPHHGVVEGAASYVVDPERGSVLSFAGTGGRVSVPGLFDEPSSVTLAGWVNIDSADRGVEVISLGDNVFLRADYADKGVAGYFHTANAGGGTTWKGTTTGVDIAGTGWRHIAYTFDADTETQKIFIDGVLGAQTAHGGSIDFSVDSFTAIGAHITGKSNFDFAGMLDDTRVYGKALSEEEIRWLANQQLAEVEVRTVIDLVSVNDPPSILDLDATPLFEEGGVAVTLDDNVAVADPELTAVDDFADASLTIQRAGGTPDSDDIFANSGLLGSLIEGEEFNYDGMSAGTVEKNSAGVLTLRFGSAATNEFVDNTLRSIVYLNVSAAPPAMVTLEWSVGDGNSLISPGQGAGGEKTVTAFSTVSISPVNSVPSIAQNSALEVGTGAVNQVVSTDELRITDIDNDAADLIFTIKSALANGVLTRQGTALGVNDSFTQLDINNSDIHYTNNDIAGTDSFEFSVSDGVDAVSDVFVVEAIDDVPSQLSPGITMNKDSGNDTYLYDTSNFNHVVGDSLQTWEFIISGVQRNSGGGDSTLYSAASTGGHSNHLAIKPDGEVEWYMQGWPVEGLSSGSFYHGTGTPIPDIYDGQMHSIAIVFDLRNGQHYYQMYIDGVLANQVPSGWSNTTINLTADFPFVLGQKLQSVDSNQPTDADSQLHFVPGDHFSGTFHDIRVWDSIRTPDELADHRFARFDVENSASPADLQINWQMTSLLGNSSVVNATAETGANSQPVTLAVKHVSDPGFIPSLPVDVLAVDENAANDTSVGFVMPRDPLPDTAGYSYELLDNADGAFSINANTGQVTVADSNKLNFSMVDHHDLVIRISGTDISGTTYSESISMVVRPINSLPVFAGTTGNVSYIENEPAVLLEPGLTISDQELSAIDNFDGATLLLSRVDFASNDDRFLSSGDLGELIEGGALFYDGLEIGGVLHNSAGELKLLFNASATNDDVNRALSSIAYRNVNDNPESTVRLEWNLADGNVLDQGAGGTGAVTYETTVSITAANDAPSIVTGAGPRSYTEDAPPVSLAPAMEIFDPELSISDFDEATVTVQRTGGANDADTFYGSGLLQDLIEGSPLVYDSRISGLVVQNSNGVLSLQFNELVTAANINDIVRTVTYSNISNTPRAEVDLQWTFSDGNTGDQGVGTAAFANIVQTVRITPAADAPVLSSNGLSLMEGETVTIDSSHLQTTDVDSTADTLQYNISSILAGHFAYATDPVVSINTFTQQQVDDGAVLFVHDGSERAPSYIVTVGDGHHTDSGTASVSFTPVNDAPVVSGVLPDKVAVLEDVASVIPISAISIADSDAGALDVTLILKTANGGLLHTAYAGALTVVGRGSGEVEISGRTDDLNAWLATSDALTYTSTPNANGTALDMISVAVSDNGNSGVGGSAQVAIAKIVVDILAVNDEPSGADSTLTIREDEPYAFKQSDFGFSDVIDDHAFFGVVIEYPPTAGQLTLSNTPLAAGDEVSVVDIDNGQLVFTPFANESGNPYTTLNFRVTDSGGNSNGGVDTGSAPNTLRLVVESVSDHPEGRDNTVSLIEDSSYVFSEPDFGFSDDADGHVLKSVVVATEPDQGELYLNGMRLAAGAAISTADITQGNFSYQAPGNAYGTALSSFEFQVQDSGADNATSLSANRIVFDVLPTGDAPSGADNTLFIEEDSEHIFTAGEFGFSDILDDNAFAAIRIASTPISGSLTLNGGVLSAGERIDVADINAGVLVFTPAPNVHGDNLYSFDFHVIDDGVSANGGVIEDPDANTMVISVTSVNDAPSADSSTIDLHEDTVYSFSASDFSFQDPVDGDNFVAVQIVDSPLSGTLMAGSKIVARDMLVTVDQINAGEFTYTPEEHESGTPYDRLLFRVLDDGGNLNGGINTSAQKAEITFNVMPVSDTPDGADNTLQVTEDVPYRFSVQDFGFSDPHDGDSFTGVTISPPVGAGTVMADSRVVAAGRFVDRNTIDSGQLLYLPPQNSFGSGLATIAFRVHDDGSVANGGVNADQSGNKLVVDIAAVNDAPDITVNAVVDVKEGGSVSIDSSALLAADIDNSPAQIIYTITTAPVNGVLYHVSASDQPVIEFTQQDINEQRIGYRHDDTEGRKDEFAYRVSDAGGVSATGITHISIEGVADAPGGADNNISIFEDEPYVIRRADFGFSDVDGDRFSSIVLTELPAAGSLLVGADQVRIDEKISINRVEDGDLVYHPASNVNGSVADRIGFLVVDNGDQNYATGSNVDPEAHHLSFEILPVSDAPVGIDSTIELYDDREYVFNTDDIGFVDAADGDQLSAIVLTALPTSGNLWLAHELVIAGQSIPVKEIENGNLSYVPPAGIRIDSSDQLQLRVVDDGALAGSRDTNISNGESVVHFQIRAVNSAPAATPTAMSISEDSAVTLGVDDFGFSDSPDNHGLKSIEIVAVRGTGDLTLSGEPIVRFTTVSVADIESGAVVYTPAPNHYGSPGTEIDFRLTDDGGTLYGGENTSGLATLTIHIDAVNDPPVAGTYGNQERPFSSEIVLQLPLDLFIDIDDDTLFFHAVQSDGEELPEWLDFDADNLRFTGHPQIDDVGTTRIRVTATDAGNGAATIEFDVTIQPPIEPPIELARAVTTDAFASPEARFSFSEIAPEPEPVPEPRVELPLPQSETSAQGRLPDKRPLAETGDYFGSIAVDSEQPDIFRYVDDVVFFDNRQTTDKTDKLSSTAIPRENLPVNNIPLGELFSFDQQQSLTNAASLLKQLDEQRDNTGNLIALDKQLVGGTIAVTSGLSIGYIIWLVRGGLLLSSVLTSMPAWRWVDPLPVLGGVGEAVDEDSQESLHSMIEHGEQSDSGAGDTDSRDSHSESHNQRQNGGNRYGEK